MMKSCNKCGGPPKPLTEFSKNASKRDGLQSHCKACNSIDNAKWHADNPGRAKASRVNRVAENPEKAKSHRAKRYTANQEKEKASGAKYYANNTEKCNAARVIWAAANPEAMRIFGHNRRARERENGGTLSSSLAAKLITLQRGKCACCGKPLGKDYHLDHIMPIKLGGANVDSNIQLLRAKCNLQKHAAHPIDFMQQRGFLL